MLTPRPLTPLIARCRGLLGGLCMLMPASTLWAQSAPPPMELAAPLAVAPATLRFDIRGFNTQGASLVGAETITRALAPFVGNGKTLQDIFAAADALKALYVRQGYPVVRVIAPDQVSGDGLIVLRVIEGKIGKILIEGNKFHDDDNIKASLPSVVGGAMPHANDIIAALALANENPAKQVAMNLQASTDPGVVNAKIDVQDVKPQSFTLGMDNSGSKLTGQYKLSVGYEHANLWNKDHVFTAQASTSPEDPSKSSSASIGYRFPIYPWGISVETVAAYSDSNSGTYNTPNGTMAFTGKGAIFGLKVNQPLASWGAYRHKLIYGWDYKDYKNTCAVSGTAQSAQTCGTITSMPLSISYSGQFNSPDYQVGGTIGHYRNIVGGPHGKAADYEFNSNGDSTHRKARWAATRTSLFGALPLGQWTLRSALSGQTSSDVLISAEQFGVGGASLVRGYSERSVAGDVGYGGNLELYTPDIGSWLPGGKTNLKALAFYDAGHIRQNKAALTGITPDQATLTSAGLGIRLDIANTLSVRLDVGVALKPLQSTSDGVARARDDAHAHLGVNLKF
jgi:hemolysin activation/secretion protein